MEAPRTRVVVVEDEAIIRLDLVETLTELGYDVVGQAGDGAAAIEVTRALRPDVVVMDINMPGVDGITATRTIVAEDLAAVIMVTAYGQRSIIEEAVAAGAAGYIVKPFRGSDVGPAIEVAVAQRGQMRVLRTQMSSLEGRVQARSVVDRATALLRDSQGLSEPEAFALLRRAAMDRRVTLAEAAAQVILHMDDEMSQTGHE